MASNVFAAAPIEVFPVTVPGWSHAPTLVWAAVDHAGRQALVIDLQTGTAPANAAEQLREELERRVGAPVRLLERCWSPQKRRVTFTDLTGPRPVDAAEDEFALRALEALRARRVVPDELA